MWGLVLAAALVSAEPQWGNNTQSKTVMHAGTGVAIGVAGGGVCTTAFRRFSGAPKTATCALITMAASGAGYFVKERSDTRKYGDGSMKSFDVQDWSEGTVGAALGAFVYVPLIEW